MKKLGFYIGVLIILILGMYKILDGIDKYYENKVKAAYANSFGNNLSNEKNKGLILQKQSIYRNDNIQIYGSSELSTSNIPSNPVNIFKDKSSGFQVNFVGRGHSQSIIHAINIAALSEDLKDEKMIIILSPQWFTASGLGQNGFETNFSELQFYSIMSNNKIDSDLKEKLADRVASLSNNKYEEFINNGFLSKARLYAITPYIKFKYYLLSIKDKVQSLEELSAVKNKPNVTEDKRVKYNWEEELKKAKQIGKEKSSNNTFGIENEYYKKYIKGKLDSLENSYKGQSYLKSPEYEDLKLLLEICKRKGLKPMFVSVPVHGKWYDYCGFSKEDRQEYYKRVNNLVESYGFKVADLSSHEYEDYFLKDIMHLGWKGWIYFDKEIDEYYNSNK